MNSALPLVSCMKILQRFYLIPFLSSGRILEALHVDPVSGVSIDKDKGTNLLKPSIRFANNG